MQLTTLLLGLALLPEYFTFPQLKRREAISTTRTAQPGNEPPTVVFYDYIIYTTTTPKLSKGSTPESVPDGTTSHMKEMNPSVQVKKRSLLDNDKLTLSSTTENSYETTMMTPTESSSTSNKPIPVVKRQTSDTGSVEATEPSGTGSVEATESLDTGDVEAMDSSDSGETEVTTVSQETSDPGAADQPPVVPEVPETPSAEVDPTEEETPEESSPVEETPEEAGPVEETPEEASPVEASPVADTTSEPIEEPTVPLQPEVMPLGNEVSPVEADSSVPGGLSSSANIKRSVSTPEKEEDKSKVNAITETIPTSPEPISSNEPKSNDIVGNFSGINQADHSENEDLMVTSSIARITQVFVIQDIFVGNNNEDILETFNKYTFKYLKGES